MPETELPAGWFVTASPEGGVNLRVSGSGRSFIAIIVLALAAYTAGDTAMRWPVLSSSSAQLRFAMLAGFALFGIWCAFGDEVWCINHNAIEHCVGIGPLQFKRNIQNAELQIIERFEAKFGRSRPYYRLYASTQEKQQFLFERKLQELQQLTQFISSRTGWRVRMR
jgi:hypothetical protein